MNGLNKPVRIQRSRQHKMINPNGLPIVYVGRPTQFGNPINKLAYWNDAKAREQYLYWVNESLEREVIRRMLKGKNLSCWCPLSKYCHADVLLKIANE